MPTLERPRARRASPLQLLWTTQDYLREAFRNFIAEVPMRASPEVAALLVERLDSLIRERRSEDVAGFRSVAGAPEHTRIFTEYRIARK